MPDNAMWKMDLGTAKMFKFPASYLDESLCLNAIASI